MNVLFVCEGNVNRSPMAAAFLHALVPSAGIRTAGTAVLLEREGKLVASFSMNAIDAMREVGLDMSASVMRQVTAEMADWADVIVLMEPAVPTPDFLLHSPKVERWDVPDPGDRKEVTHAVARDLIEGKVREFALRLASSA
ncbi:MAG: hypothetical protein KGI41_03470 [Patescibacteria group bacterium]|nr:hypothetical protein [Patescibacteria group bacterium]MDE1966270.1 hypothetical protein [Patescibacteria group bacterium]